MALINIWNIDSLVSIDGSSSMVGYSVTFVMLFLYVVETTDNLLNSISSVKDYSFAPSSHTFQDEAPFNVFISSIGV